MYNEQYNGKDRWQQFIEEADEYRRAHKFELGKKKSSSLVSNLRAQFLSIFTS